MHRFVHAGTPSAHSSVMPPTSFLPSSSASPCRSRDCWVLCSLATSHVVLTFVAAAAAAVDCSAVVAVEISSLSLAVDMLLLWRRRCDTSRDIRRHHQQQKPPQASAAANSAVVSHYYHHDYLLLLVMVMVVAHCQEKQQLLLLLPRCLLLMRCCCCCCCCVCAAAAWYLMINPLKAPLRKVRLSYLLRYPGP